MQPRLHLPGKDGSNLDLALRGSAAYVEKALPGGVSAKGNQQHRRLRVPLYKQTTDFTCGACAALMVWRYFDTNVELSRRNEFLIWTETAALPFKFSSPYRIAEFFIKRGFEAKLVMKQGGRTELEAPFECCLVDASERALFVDFFKRYNRIVKERVASAVIDREPTLYSIRRSLSAGNPAILLADSYYAVKARGAHRPLHLPHWIVVTGHDTGEFRINDSITEKGLGAGKIVLKDSVLREAMDTYHRFGWPSALIVVAMKTKALPEIASR
jgi:hypothetical protein